MAGDRSGERIADMGKNEEVTGGEWLEAGNCCELSLASQLVQDLLPNPPIFLKDNGGQ